MLRARYATSAVVVVALLPSCSLLIDSTPDGVIKEVAGRDGTDNGKAGTSPGGAPASSNATGQNRGGTSTATTTGGVASGATTNAATSLGGAPPQDTTSLPGGSTSLATSGGATSAIGGANPGGGTTSMPGVGSTTSLNGTGGTVANSTRAAGAGGVLPGGAGTTSRGGTGGGAVGGTSAAGGTTATGGTSAACTDEGCACTSGSIACNDCGTRTCNATTKKWGACSASQSPAATQCAANTLQTCGSDGKWASVGCTTSDTNCAASCTTSAGTSSCKVAAKDADADGHGSKLCAAAPGDDCDDGNQAIYPGATEICDGFDNDCNGKADLKDGLPLAGAASAEPYTVYDMAWSPTSQKFGVIGVGSSGRAFFANLTRTPPASHTITWMSTPSADVGQTIYPQLTWSSTRGFVMAYGQNGRSMPSEAHVQDINEQGVISTGFIAMGTELDAIGARSSGDSLVISVDSTYTWVSRYTGSALENGISIERHSGQRIAMSGDQAAVVYFDTGEGVGWYRISSSLAAFPRTILDPTARFPAIGTVANGYAVAWGTSTGFDYTVLSSANGAAICGPTHVPTSEVTYLAIAATQYGNLVLTAGAEVRLFRFDASCTVTDNVLIDASGSQGDHPVLAVGGGNVALAWWMYTSSFSTGSTMVVGERLCN